VGVLFGSGGSRPRNSDPNTGALPDRVFEIFGRAFPQ
jgi:hypothetical protein